MTVLWKVTAGLGKEDKAVGCSMQARLQSNWEKTSKLALKTGLGKSHAQIRDCSWEQEPASRSLHNVENEKLRRSLGSLKCQARMLLLLLLRRRRKRRKITTLLI